MLNQRSMPWIMWSFPLTFFGLQFVLRLFPGLIMNEFLEKYQITATHFGIFVALYYLGYAGMQIPLALLLDRIGARKIISSCIILCGIATWLLVLADTWIIALISRFFIGAGSVVGFLGATKVISQWFDSKSYSRLIGLTFSFGLLGAVYGGRPISMLISNLGWEKVNFILGTVTLILGIFTFLFLRDKPRIKENQQPVFISLKKLFSYRALLIIAFANFLMVGSLEGFADVWGVSYLMTARNLSKNDAAGITSYIFIGMLFGGPLLAYLAQKWKSQYSITFLCGILMASLLFSILFFNPWIPQWSLKLIMFILGLLCCYQVIIFAIGAQMVPTYLMSITIAFLNCINMLGGSFFHSMIGKLMDHYQQNIILTQTKSYSLDAYTFTLMLIPIASLIGAGLVWWSKYVDEKSELREDGYVYSE